jgi:hypothetical protein
VCGGDFRAMLRCTAPRLPRVAALLSACFLAAGGASGCGSVSATATSVASAPAPNPAPTPNPPAQPVPILQPSRARRFEGWGVSLAWWAEVVGRWTSAQRDRVLGLLFGDPGTPLVTAGGVRPLGLNVVRYNFGASAVDGMGCKKVAFRPGGAVPSVIPASGARPDLSLDRAQIEVLRASLALIHARQGVRARLEAFANSPPWWLLDNRCPQGAGEANVLQSGTATSEYAAYLRDVAQAFQAGRIDFETIDPLNEPGGFWDCSKGSGSCQEGAHFEPPLQTEILRQACSALSPLGISVSGDDGETPSETLSYLTSQASVLGCVKQINTHSYATGQEDQLAQTVHSEGRPLWMSEYGNKPADCPGQDPETCIGTGVELARHLVEDLDHLTPDVWAYWTGIEGPTGWGLLTDSSYSAAGPAEPAPSDVKPSARFWALSQFTRFIPAGSTIYPVGSSGPGGISAVVARDPAGEVVIAAINPASNQQSLELDLQLIAPRPERPDAYLTDATHHVAPVAAHAYMDASTFRARLAADSITTYVFVTSRLCGGNGAFSSVTARDVSCQEARRVADTWASTPGCGPSPGYCRVMGFTCGALSNGDSTPLRCQRGSERIGGILRPY